MSDAYEKAKTGRLTYKGGSLATLKSSIDKKKHKKKKNKNKNKIDEAQPSTDEIVAEISITETDNGAEELGYTIDAAKCMKYDELFPVEAKKFGYEPKKVSKSVEEVLDDRVKKKADRYCK